MINQFSRLELLIGTDALAKLKTKKVAVFGLGGVGGNVCDGLVRSGITNIAIIDNDSVTISNINRQLIANVETIGLAKTDVMEKHLKSLNPEVKVDKYKMFYLPQNSDNFDFASFDYVVDAIDTVSAKIDIVLKCHELNIPVISAMGCGNRLDPLKLVVADLFKTENDPLAKVMRYELRKRNIKKLKVVYSKEPAIKPETISEEDSPKRAIPGSSAFVPPVAGILIAKEVIFDLLKKEEAHNEI